MRQHIVQLNRQLRDLTAECYGESDRVALQVAHESAWTDAEPSVAACQDFADAVLHRIQLSVDKDGTTSVPTRLLQLATAVLEAAEASSPDWYYWLSGDARDQTRRAAATGAALLDVLLASDPQIASGVVARMQVWAGALAAIDLECLRRSLTAIAAGRPETAAIVGLLFQLDDAIDEIETESGTEFPGSDDFTEALVAIQDQVGDTDPVNEISIDIPDLERRIAEARIAASALGPRRGKQFVAAVQKACKQLGIAETEARALALRAGFILAWERRTAPFWERRDSEYYVIPVENYSCERFDQWLATESRREAVAYITGTAWDFGHMAAADADDALTGMTLDRYHVLIPESRSASITADRPRLWRPDRQRHSRARPRKVDEITALFAGDAIAAIQRASRRDSDIPVVRKLGLVEGLEALIGAGQADEDDEGWRHDMNEPTPEDRRAQRSWNSLQEVAAAADQTTFGPVLRMMWELQAAGQPATLRDASQALGKTPSYGGNALARFKKRVADGDFPGLR